MTGAVAGNDLPLSDRPITPASLSTIGTSCVTVDAGRQRLVADEERADHPVRHLELGVVVRVVHADRGPLAVKSYVNVSPGFTGGWVTSGTPSIAFGTSMPWKWIAVDSGSLLSSTTRTWSPRLHLDRRAGNGAVVRPGLHGLAG